MNLYGLLKVVSEPSRLKILYCLNTKDLCVQELQDILELSQANVSKHLKMLLDNDMVVKQKVNQNSIYSINPSYADNCQIFHPLIGVFDNSEEANIIRKRMAKGA